MIAKLTSVPSIPKLGKSEGLLKTAAGTKERNGPQKLSGRGTLKLVCNSDGLDTPKKVFRIGVCENVFSHRGNAPGDATQGHSEPRKGDENQKDSSDLTVVITCAVLGLVLGYVVGKSRR
jgi:hypothetical protein